MKFKVRTCIFSYINSITHCKNFLFSFVDTHSLTFSPSLPLSLFVLQSLSRLHGDFFATSIETNGEISLKRVRAAGSLSESANHSMSPREKPTRDVRE